MDYLHTDLGHCTAGTMVIVELAGTEANVLLLDDSNLGRYRNGGQYRYVGGHFTQSPVRLAVPSNGRWNVVVDLGGYAGRISAQVRVIAA